jgi:tRNA A-37 threonylcarbamoyl transferase component Bud32
LLLLLLPPLPQVLLDLGLSISSSYPEDKGVDLLLLLQDMTQTQQQQQQQQQDAAADGGKEGSVQQQGDAGLKTVRRHCTGRHTRVYI